MFANVEEEAKASLHSSLEEAAIRELKVTTDPIPINRSGGRSRYRSAPAPDPPEKDAGSGEARSKPSISLVTSEVMNISELHEEEEEETMV